MSDPLATHARHQRLIRREELRAFVGGTLRFLDVPHLICDGDGHAFDPGSAVTVGTAPFPELFGANWVLPAGAWVCDFCFEQPGSDRLELVLRAGAEYWAGAYVPLTDYQVRGTFESAGTDLWETAATTGQLSLGPLVSDGALNVWVDGDVPGPTKIVFGRLG